MLVLTTQFLAIATAALKLLVSQRGQPPLDTPDWSGGLFDLTVLVDMGKQRMRFITIYLIKHQLN